MHRIIFGDPKAPDTNQLPRVEKIIDAMRTELLAYVERNQLKP